MGRSALLQRFNQPHFKKTAYVVMGEPKPDFTERVHKKLLAITQTEADEAWHAKKAVIERKKAERERAKAAEEKKKQIAEAQKRIKEEAAKRRAEAEKKRAEDAAAQQQDDVANAPKESEPTAEGSEDKEKVVAAPEAAV